MVRSYEADLWSIRQEPQDRVDAVEVRRRGEVIGSVQGDQLCSGQRRNERIGGPHEVLLSNNDKGRHRDLAKLANAQRWALRTQESRHREAVVTCAVDESPNDARWALGRLVLTFQSEQDGRKVGSVTGRRGVTDAEDRYPAKRLGSTSSGGEQRYSPSREADRVNLGVEWAAAQEDLGRILRRGGRVKTVPGKFYADNLTALPFQQVDPARSTPVVFVGRAHAVNKQYRVRRHRGSIATDIRGVRQS